MVGFLCYHAHWRVCACLVLALTEVCVVAVAGNIEREARRSRLGAVSRCARPQTADKFQASPPLSGPLTLNSF